MIAQIEVDKRDKLQLALQKLPLKDRAELDLQVVIDTLLIITQQPFRVDPHYLDKGRLGVDQELAEAVKLASDLRSLMQTIHRPTYELLYNAGIRPYDIMQFCYRFIDVCKLIDTSKIPEKPPRKKTQIQAKYLTEYLAGAFEMLTNRRATIITKDGAATGPFLTVVAEVFAVLAIKASPEAWAKHAVRKRKTLGMGQITPFETTGPVS